MRVLSSILVIFFIHLCFLSFAQRMPALPEYTIDGTNDAYYFEKSKHLLGIADRDSLFEAQWILRILPLLDSIKYSAEFLKPHFAKYQTAYFAYLKNNIIGQWRFEWSGSNWGTEQTSATRNEKVVFTDTEAFFYKGDTLKRQTKYLITDEHSSRFPRGRYFQLYFLDNKVRWDFSFQAKGIDYLTGLKFDRNSIGLHINEEPNCSCGCPERTYIKQ
ncbi:MAG: hypothetical protein EOP48_19285 [Sphingobacteriales bacterium]|nr:MAG: hypothetical protein EOP48_19285 [Sphingobacteriales bacterium]